jgi:hypothetical protein
MSEPAKTRDQPGIHLDTTGNLYLYADGDYELWINGNRSSTTWGYHHSMSQGETLGGYIGARQTWVVGADTTLKAGVDVTTKVAADISLFLGPKVEAAATVGKVAAAKSIVSAAHSHTFGEAAKIGAVSNAVEALEQRCSAERMAAIGNSIKATGAAVSALADSTLTAAMANNLVGIETNLNTTVTNICSMNSQISALTTMV